MEDKQPVETDSPKTPRLIILRKTSDPKVAKGITISDRYIPCGLRRGPAQGELEYCFIIDLSYY